MHDERDLSMVTFMMVFNGAAQGDPNLTATHLMSNILGSDMSPRLFKSVRVDRGLAYTVGTGNYTYHNNGLAMIFVAAKKDTAGLVLLVVVDEIKKIMQETVAPQELERAKKAFLVGLADVEETAGSRQEYAVNNWLHDDQVPSFDEERAKINAVDVGAVQAAAQKVFSGLPTIATIGPGKSLLRYEHILDQLKF